MSEEWHVTTLTLEIWLYLKYKAIVDCVQHQTSKLCCCRNRMNNSLANVPLPRLVVSRYSRVIRSYSFQEILLEYCICLLLLVFVALVIFGVRFLRSELRGRIFSGNCPDGIPVLWDKLWMWIYSFRCMTQQMREDETLTLRYLALLEEKRNSCPFYNFKEIKQHSSEDLYLGKEKYYWWNLFAQDSVELVASMSFTSQSDQLPISLYRSN